MFLATIADGKTVASWGEGHLKTQKTHPESAFWMGPHWVGPWALVLVLLGKDFKSCRTSKFTVVSKLITDRHFR